MLKLKLQYFGNLMGRADSLEKTLTLGKTEGRRRGGNRNRELQHVFPVAQLEAPGPGLEIQPAPGPCSQLAAVSLSV